MIFRVEDYGGATFKEKKIEDFYMLLAKHTKVCRLIYEWSSTLECEELQITLHNGLIIDLNKHFGNDKTDILTFNRDHFELYLSEYWYPYKTIYYEFIKNIRIKINDEWVVVDKLKKNKNTLDNYKEAV